MRRKALRGGSTTVDSFHLPRELGSRSFGLTCSHGGRRWGKTTCAGVQQRCTHDSILEALHRRVCKGRTNATCSQPSFGNCL